MPSPILFNKTSNNITYYYHILMYVLKVQYIGISAYSDHDALLPSTVYCEHYTVM